MDFLVIRKLSRFFGGLAAVMDLDMVVDRGQIFGLIGPNGAGKSTVLNMIGGTMRPNQGEIIFNEKEVTRLHCAQPFWKSDFRLINPVADNNLTDGRLGRQRR